MTNTNARLLRLLRSALAIIAGFIVVAVLSLATDEVLHLLGVYPPWGQPMVDTRLNLLALAYRIVYTILGGYITARFAPAAPLCHAVILGVVGLVPGAAGVIIASGMDLGPLWYPVALALVGLPCCWLGGVLHRLVHGEGHAQFAG